MMEKPSREFEAPWISSQPRLVLNLLVDSAAVFGADEASLIRLQ
jgi:hypothetical protein